MVHDQHREPAPAQLQQPLLDRRPGVGIVLAQLHGQARQVVEDQQLHAFEPGIELGLHGWRAQVADAALHPVGGGSAAPCAGCDGSTSQSRRVPDHTDSTRMSDAFAKSGIPATASPRLRDLC
jgi:hypothetical protein